MAIANIFAAFCLSVALAASASAASLTQYPLVSDAQVTSGPGGGGRVYTWSNGIFRRVPPQGFSFATATSAQREYYGIPPWETDLSDITIAAPSAALFSDSNIPPPGSYEGDYNWAGPQVTDTSGLWADASYYYQPAPAVTPYSLADPCRHYGYEGDYIWAGMGLGSSDNTNLFQDGTFIGYYLNSSGQGEAYPDNDFIFIAYWPTTTAYFDPQTVRPGDYVEAAVLNWGPNSSGDDQLEFYVKDITTGEAYTYGYLENPQVNGFDADLGEGILEQESASNYATVDFGSASSPYNFAYPSPVGNYAYLSFNQLPWLDWEAYGQPPPNGSGSLDIGASAPGAAGAESWTFNGCN